MNDDRSLTPAEVAEQLKIAKNTVYELIKRGELQSYRVGKKIRVECQAVEALKGKRTPAPTPLKTVVSDSGRAALSPGIEGMVICGQDMILDILARRIETLLPGTHIFRSHMGSYNAVYSLYLGEVQAATAHMWDRESNSYNLPYVRKMLPGTATTLIHICQRYQGFYVKKNNPLNITKWEDLTRGDIRFINREKGSGTRILLDEKILERQWSSEQINGYNEESSSHMVCASRVSRDDADVALGCERAALQVPGIDFIPLQKETYHMIIRKQDENKLPYSTMIEILQSDDFHKEIESLGGYDVSKMGKISFSDVD
jgi:putative molybdopterin biosynthesis protein